MRNASRVGRLFGIDLAIDTRWLFIFSIVVWSLNLAGWRSSLGERIPQHQAGADVVEALEGVPVAALARWTWSNAR